MRLHIVSLPHTQTTYAYSWCAYTQKVVKLCNMMMSLGHEVYLYSGWENEAACTQHVTIVNPEDHAKWWPQHKWTSKTPGIFGDWEKTSPCWVEMNKRAVREIRKRCSMSDIVGAIVGVCQEPLSKIGLICAEWGIGYEGVLGSDVPKAWESYAHRHYVHGMIRDNILRPLDCVIPNSFELKHFPQGSGGNHFVYLGRMIGNKGVETAAAVCRALGAKLVLAGQGVKSHTRGLIVTDDGMNIRGDVEYVGVVNPQERAKLLGGARGAFVATKYLGPFEGVAVEAMLCGTPVLTTDWGCFVETVQQGVSGYRCNSEKQFVEAAKKIGELDRGKVREWAMQYTTDRVQYQYQEWFQSLIDDRFD